ncbi:hypothetical protein LRS74_23850 [Streptomyces sp. LX-29]|uniref:SCO2400 family protein n=1 Tax=Streptomyces sp. LX-29 TaxID=2900152 RepID=UPI00240D5E8B|nr:hypothetical protein [Streptomyces sp. LX-29]WFB09741.1 hypothetical protein LRS74_23850 [Streptomyces sp. LX-29]
MDYCPPCRRHLNGALSCPGCGTPAAELSAPSDESGPATASLPALAEDPWSARRASRKKPRPVREAGRSRRARRGPRRRIAVLAAALGPVLAAVFVAELATEGSLFRDPAPRPAREQPVADRSPHGGVSGESGADAVDPAAGPSSGGVEESGPAGAGATDPAEKDAEPGEDARDGAAEADGESRDGVDGAADEAAPGETAGGAAEVTAPTAGGASGTPSGGGSAPAPTTSGGGSGPAKPSDRPSHPVPSPSQKPSLEPVPEPEPTCDQFLWWCT